MGIVAGIGALGSLGSSIIGSNAASNAAGVQAQATQQALDLQQKEFNRTRHQLQPYMSAGKSATASLSAALPDLTKPFAPTQQQLESTPGYQFDLSQGLKSTQNSAAARGLGLSGAAMKGAASYATGLADNTLQTQFNIDQANKTNAFNKYFSTASLGENAAANAGSTGAGLANASANTLLTGAQGQSSADIAQASAFTNPLLNNLGSYYMLSQMKSNGLFGNKSS